MAARKKEQTPASFEEAQEELKEILHQLQSDRIQIDELTSRIQRARTLVEYCRDKLRETQTQLTKLLDFDDESE
jgi:exodeoxyribonuclease VII small subunit